MLEQIKKILRLKITQNIFIFFLVTLLLLSCIELYFKFFSPQILIYTTKGMHIADKGSQFRLTPNFSGVQTYEEYIVNIKINSLGFRNREIDVKKPEDVYRIVCLGDSFTMGYGVEAENTWCSKLEKLLNKYPPPIKSTIKRIEVINCGVGGYGTRQEIAFYRNYCRKLSPDLIVLGFFMGNDFFDNAQVEPLTIADGLLINKSSLADYNAKKKKIFSLSLFLNRFHTAQFVKNRLKSIKDNKVIPKMDEWWKNQFYHQLAILLKNPPERISQEFDETLNFINDFNIELENDGKDFILMLIPFREQAVNVRKETVVKKILINTYKLSQDDFDYSMPQKRMLEFCETHGILACDVLPNMTRAENNDQLYYLYDVHLTDAGHKLTAETLHRFMLRREYK